MATTAERDILHQPVILFSAYSMICFEVKISSAKLPLDLIVSIARADSIPDVSATH